jgi:hypothetical protein
MTSKLFSVTEPTPTTHLETPIGTLNFYPEFATGKVSKLTLLQGSLEPHLPKDMSVSACSAVLLQFNATEKLTGFKFNCIWEDLDRQGHASTGEALDAWEWEHDGCEVAIGTEDAEWLSMRSPAIFFDFATYPITMNENKISIQIPELPAGNSYSFHFIIAWKEKTEPEDCSCWLAVDQPHKLVIENFS